MGFSDQKYYSRPLSMFADSNIATATYTASATNNSITSAWPLRSVKRASTVNGGELVVKTAPKIGQTILSFLNGTNTFATATVSSTATAGTIITISATNTAVVTTNTFTNTKANGSTYTGTNTTTTNYGSLAADTQPTVTAAGTATASADTIGAYEVFFEVKEDYT